MTYGVAFDRSNTFLRWFDVAKGTGSYDVETGTEIEGLAKIENTGTRATKFAIQLWDWTRSDGLGWDTRILQPDVSWLHQFTFDVSRDYDLSLIAYYLGSDGNYHEGDRKGRWDITEVVSGPPNMHFKNASITVDGHDVPVAQPINVRQGSVVSYSATVSNDGFGGDVWLILTDLLTNTEIDRIEENVPNGGTVTLSNSFNVDKSVDLMFGAGHNSGWDDSYGDFVIDVGQADISVIDINIPSYVTPNTEVTIDVTVKNTGLGSGNSCIWLTDRTNRAVGFEIIAKKTVNVASDETKTISLTVKSGPEEVLKKYRDFKLCASAHEGSC